MGDVHHTSQLIIVVITAGILAQAVSGIFKLPSIIFLLLFGVVLGPEGIGAVHPDHLGIGLDVIVTIAVALILFEGSLTLNLRHIRKVQHSVQRLVTIGLLFTFGGAAAAATYLVGLPIKYALIFGALVSVTGPTVIRPLVRRITVRNEIATILEGEGILADPIGAILAVFALEFALGEGASLGDHFIQFGIRVGAGIAVGAVIGGLMAMILHLQRKQGEGLKSLVITALVLAGYGIAENVRHEAGIMAVVAMGLMAQLGMKPHERELRAFKEQLTTLLISMLFILLAANLKIDAMRAQGLPGLYTVLIVMLVIRPINILYSTWGGKPNFREKIFLSWTAPRGIIAAAVASLAALKLTNHASGLFAAGEITKQTFEMMTGYAQSVEALVFMTIFLTVMLQGTTAGMLAHVMGILAKEEGRVLVIGANHLARGIAHRFKNVGREVCLIDTNATNCERAMREGLNAICGSATDREILRSAGILDVDTFLACSVNMKVNELAAQVAHQDFDLKHVYVAIDPEEQQGLDPMLEREGVKLAFGSPIPLEMWSSDIRSKRARIEIIGVTRQNLPERAATGSPFPKNVVPLLAQSGKVISIYTNETRFQLGDLVHVLVRDVPRHTLEHTLRLRRHQPPAQ